MGFFDKIKEKLTTGSLKKEQLERLRESLWNAVADGEVTDTELEYINGFWRSSDLSQEDFDRLRNEVFCGVVQQAISDRRVSENELNVLNHLVERLSISPEVERHIERQVQYYSLFAKIESGAPLPIGQPSGVILKKGELCHVSMPASLLEERVVSRNYAGGSRGVSVRIMKGVSYRVGQQKGQMTSQTGLITVSKGYFVVTNQRLVFSGDRKSVNTPFDKLLDLHLFSDGLNFSSSLRQKPVIVQFPNGEDAEVCGLVITRLINEV
jgi:hypothetical protein